MRGWLRFAGALLVGPVACASIYGCTSETDAASETPVDKSETPPAAAEPASNGGGAAAPVILPSAKAKQIVVGSYHACALLEDGTVRCWGYSGEGEIGNGHALGNDVKDSLIFFVPVAVPNLRDVKAISSMDRFTCALTNQGGVKCWGQDELGQLGTGVPYTDNRPHMSSSPVDVKDLGSGVASISAGYDSACAVMSTGTVKCWGHDEYGKLGNGVVHTSGEGPWDFLAPVDVKGLTDVVQVSVGMFHACAVTKAGKAYCWGTNMQGELGIGDGTPKDALPNEITSLGSDVVSIWAGWETTCAIMKNGGLKCWGDDDDESVGDGQSDILRKVTSPVDVIGLGPGSGVTLVAPSENKTTCAVANGAAKCWGKSHALGLAQGRDYETYQPNGNVQTLDANVAEVAVGTGYACARLRDGSVKCWGGGDSGQLGHGPTEGMGQVFEEKPVPVLSLP